MIRLQLSMMPTKAPYGSWRSPVTASLLTAQSRRPSEPRLDGDRLYWLESRPDQQGRSALMMLDADGRAREVLAAPHSVRTRVHEYGGGSYTVHDGVVYLVLDADQRVYRLPQDSAEPQPLSAEGPWRYAGLHVDAAHQRLLCVREDHSRQNEEERSEIIALALDGSGRVEVLASGADFYSNPRPSPDGRQLSFLCWHHPQMPWDGTECHLAQLDGQGAVVSSQRIAGGPNESVFQPQWSPSGELFFVSDRSDWWNLYRWNGHEAEALCPMAAEFATPQWTFGMSTYGFLDADHLL
jgi:dipeptidyl aminopeptidase/acylaminoacyl peptidase